MTNEIFGKTANHENLQAPEIEELDDSQALAVVGGSLVGGDIQIELNGEKVLYSKYGGTDIKLGTEDILAIAN